MEYDFALIGKDFRGGKSLVDGYRHRNWAGTLTRQKEASYWQSNVLRRGVGDFISRSRVEKSWKKRRGGENEKQRHAQKQKRSKKPSVGRVGTLEPG